MEKKTISLGFIGTGIAANDLHWPAIEQLGNKFNVAAVCNRSRNKAEAFAKKCKATVVYDTVDELLADKNVDAVVVAVPIELNYGMARLAIASGKHVLLEKPLAASLDEAKILRDLVPQNRQVLLLAENFRYHKAFTKIKELMAGNAIGEVISFCWNDYKSLHVDNKYATPWRMNNQYPGGFIFDGGIHNVAALRMIFGDVQTQVSATKSVNPAIGTIDTLISTLVFENGVTGNLNLCYSTNGFEQNRLLVLGKNGSICFENDELKLYSQSKVELLATTDLSDSYLCQFDDFYNCIVSGAAPQSTFAEGVKDIELMVRLLEA